MAGSLMEVLLVFGLALLCSGASGVPTQVSYDSNAFIINGERRVLFSGAIHYPRSTPGMWPDLIRKAKEGGLDMIETYIFWDRHEPKRGEFDFSGNLDFINFFKTVQEAGLYVFVRIGPYACAEWNYGGFPVWLHNLPGIKLRTDNEVYKNEMQKFVTKIVNMCKEAKLFGPQGGPIILAQIENEYGNVMGPYGEAGKSYIKWCAELAVSLNVGVPWVMCKQADAPEPMINTCNGFYCNTFKPNNPKNPKMLTENWVGWFVRWGGRKPHRPAEDLALSVALFFQSGGIFMNYYMYHGGTNFGRTAGGPYIATSYEYDAPLDEYGNLNQPKWGHLKQLHAAIKSVEKILTNSTSTTKEFGNANLTTYTNAATGERVCFLSNLNTTQDAHIDLQKDGKYFVPAWSVSILEGCNKEIYNSAKISTQETVMVKKPDGAENRLAKLSWQWTAEPLEDRLDGRGDFTEPKLLEQTATTLDASDYLWYMTSVNITDKAWTNAILRVNTTGHVLHAYVNGKLVGYKWADVGGIFNFTFEKNVTLNPGINRITLLSAAVGLKNYGAFYDTNTTGIVGGPVELVGKENATIDLSSNLWSYKVGLNGEAMELYNVKQPNNTRWTSERLPVSRPMTWYKATFKAPSGTEPVVVDMQGMGKGHAWVNGNSLGRFWPSFVTGTELGCNSTCDYRRNYTAFGMCLSNCGQPIQRWYHVPRSFLRDDTNTLVLFEEFGGNPSQVSFQTVTVGSTCGNTYEGNTLELSCQGGKTISEIQFASFGDPQGTCGSFKKGSCEAANALFVIQKACIGKEACKINVTEAAFGSSNCSNNVIKRLAVQAVC